MMISYIEIIIISKRNTLFHLKHRAMESTRAIHTTLITPEGEHTFQPTASPPPMLSVAHISHSPQVHPEPAAAEPVPEPAAAEPVVDKRRFVAPEPLDRDRKRRRSLTSDTIDCVTKKRNVILPLNQLLEFIENSFCCKRCNKTLTRCDEEQQVPPLGLEVFGLACGLNFKCECGMRESLRPVTVPEATPKLKTLQDGNPYGTRVNAGDFEINRRLQIGLQLCGDGRQEGKALAGMLNLNVNPMKNKWTEVQETIGKVIIDIGKEVLEENLHFECVLSPRLAKMGAGPWTLPVTLVGTKGARHAAMTLYQDVPLPSVSGPSYLSKSSACLRFASSAPKVLTTTRTSAPRTTRGRRKEWRPVEPPKSPVGYS